MMPFKPKISCTPARYWLSFHSFIHRLCVLASQDQVSAQEHAEAYILAPNLVCPEPDNDALHHQSEQESLCAQ